MEVTSSQRSSSPHDAGFYNIFSIKITLASSKRRAAPVIIIITRVAYPARGLDERKTHPSQKEGRKVQCQQAAIPLDSAAVAAALFKSHRAQKWRALFAYYIQYINGTEQKGINTCVCGRSLRYFSLLAISAD